MVSYFPAVAIVGPRQVGKTFLVEIKYSTTPKLSKGFHIAKEDLKTQKHFIICPVETGFPLAENVRVISVNELYDLF